MHTIQQQQKNYLKIKTWMLSPGGGGGGALPYVCMFRMYVPHGRPHFQNFFMLKPFIAAHSRLTAASPNEKRSGSPPELVAGQSTSQTRPIQSVPETPTFTLELAPEPRIFTLELTPEPPIFHFAVAHTYQFRWVPSLPPPPPPGSKVPKLLYNYPFTILDGIHTPNFQWRDIAPPPPFKFHALHLWMHLMNTYPVHSMQTSNPHLWTFRPPPPNCINWRNPPDPKNIDPSVFYYIAGNRKCKFDRNLEEYRHLFSIVAIAIVFCCLRKSPKVLRMKWLVYRTENMWSPHILFLSLIFGGIIYADWKKKKNSRPYLRYISVTRYTNTTIWGGGGGEGPYADKEIH